MSQLGYSVGRNKPYAGGFITEHYGNPASGLHAVQLELNRAIYMDERRRERSPRFSQVASDFAVLADVLALARSHFGYVPGAKAKLEFEIGDARLSLVNSILYALLN